MIACWFQQLITKKQLLTLWRYNPSRENVLFQRSDVDWRFNIELNLIASNGEHDNRNSH